MINIITQHTHTHTHTHNLKLYESDELRNMFVGNRIQNKFCNNVTKVWKTDLYTLSHFLYDSENIDDIVVSIATVVLLKPKKHLCVHILHNYSKCPVIPKVRLFGFEIYEKCTVLELAQFSRFTPSVRHH